MLTVIAKMPIKEGKMDEAIKEVRGLLVKVAKEQGTVLYSLNVETANPNTLVVVEQYTDQDALNFHSSTPYFKEYFTRASVLLGGAPEIVVMKEIARAK
jgi:quinol monooxygenase YgiN